MFDCGTIIINHWERKDTELIVSLDVFIIGYSFKYNQIPLEQIPPDIFISCIQMMSLL